MDVQITSVSFTLVATHRVTRQGGYNMYHSCPFSKCTPVVVLHPCPLPLPKCRTELEKLGETVPQPEPMKS